MISERTIQDIKDRLDIVEVINHHVPLKKVGRNFTACCPFHDEKTPSFSVSQEKQFYHCFGCGAGGDLISFYSKYNGYSFSQAIGSLSAMAGITIDKEVSKVMPKAIKETMEDDRMIIFMANEYEKTGVKLSYQDKQRKKLAIARHEGLTRKWISNGTD